MVEWPRLACNGLGSPNLRTVLARQRVLRWSFNGQQALKDVVIKPTEGPYEAQGSLGRGGLGIKEGLSVLIRNLSTQSRLRTTRPNSAAAYMRLAQIRSPQDLITLPRL
jgi:hypothetical protein